MKTTQPALTAFVFVARRGSGEAAAREIWDQRCQDASGNARLSRQLARHPSLPAADA